MKKKSHKINHLYFADDVIIFTSGTRKSLKKMMRTLRAYEDVSGRQVNKHKSSIILHSKASLKRTNKAKLITGMKKESFPHQLSWFSSIYGKENNFYVFQYDPKDP